MANSKLSNLVAAFNKKTSGGGSGDQTWKLKYPFWKMEEGATATVRFLPDRDESNELCFIVENLTHELVINGKKETVACASMHGERCPICELSARYYAEEGDGSVNGKKYYRKKSYLGQVIVIDSPFEHDADQLVKLIEFGPQVYKQIQAAFNSGDLEEAPYEMKGGYNFRFRKTKTGSGQNSYTTSNFAPKQTDLEDEIIEKINLYKLSDYRAPKVAREALEAMLIAEQTGTALDVSTKAPVTPAPTAQSDSAPASSVKEDSASVDSAPKAELGAKASSVIEQMKAREAARRAAAAAAAANNAE